MPDEKKVGKATRQSHRKSRNGCINCKRRKVKCDELRPQCTKCTLFGVRCTFAGDSVSSELPAPVLSDHEASRPRGRGRPRKNWAVDSGTPECENTTSPSASATSEPTTHNSWGSSLSIEEAELLLHFTQVTAYTLAGNTAVNDPMLRFWSYNLPRIGLAHHFVLRLAYALAAYHIAYHDSTDSSKKLKYRDMAEHHASLGLRQLTPILAGIDKDNCGAAYIAATLVCYCTFAAGPAGSGDLLVCNLDTTHDTAWLPLIYGVRLIRERFAEDVLFAGLMEPFMGTKSQAGPETPSTDARRARCYREGFKRLDWERSLKELREFVASQTFEGADICLRGLDGMIPIYEAAFGDEDAIFDGSSDNQFVFGWLYRLEKAFVGCLQRNNSTALIILAYYAVLLRTENLWCIDGWADHLLATVRGLVEDDYTEWLHWPTEALQQRLR
ncbi:hypothetical protein ANO14919_007830 [Xylariales sp. No.14919]|nr:hypothetical protein ANO14919_007830 [Xylariales sp. No.14919]